MEDCRKGEKDPTFYVAIIPQAPRQMFDKIIFFKPLNKQESIFSSFFSCRSQNLEG